VIRRSGSPWRPHPAAAVVVALLALAVSAALPALASPIPVSAGPGSVRSWVIQSFEVDIRVLPDGALSITETIRPRFEGKYNGIFRLIPIEVRVAGGLNHSVFLDVRSVTDGSGNSLEYKSSREGHFRKLKIWVPGAENAVRTVVIEYRVRNALLFEDEYDELYWNATGDEWPVPIESARVRVWLPEGVTGVRAQAFTGGYGSREQAARVEIDERQISVRALRELGFREGLTVDVAWDPGVVRRPTLLDKAGFLVRSNLVLLFPVLVFLFMYNLWKRNGRDPKIGSISPQYEPPKGLTPAELGTLIDSSADMKDVTATIVDLAVRGFLTIEEIEKKQLFGLFSEKEFRFELRRDWHAEDSLKPHERRLLDALFEGGSRSNVELSDLQNEFYRDLPDIKDRIFGHLMKRHYYRQRPDKVKQAWIGGGIAVSIAAFIGLGVLSAAFGLSFIALVIAGILTLGIVITFGGLMPARTMTGTRALQHALGFEEFLDRVEEDRFKRMITGPEQFERFLPFAMALGVEKKWAAAFADIYREPPQWYHGGNVHGFHPSLFVNELNDMSTRSAAAMSSSPRSQGGSGFSGGGGGGFSGGGFGGGGGGAF